MWQACCELKERGLIGRLALELFVSCSEEGVRAIERGLFDAYAFYYSVVDREVTNRAFRAFREQQAGIISIRTVGGGKILPAQANNRTTTTCPGWPTWSRRSGIQDAPTGWSSA